MKKIEIEFADSNIMHDWENPDALFDNPCCVHAIGFLKSEDENKSQL